MYRPYPPTVSPPGHQGAAAAPGFTLSQLHSQAKCFFLCFTFCQEKKNLSPESLILCYKLICLLASYIYIEARHRQGKDRCVCLRPSLGHSPTHSQSLGQAVPSEVHDWAEGNGEMTEGGSQQCLPLLWKLHRKKPENQRKMSKFLEKSEMPKLAQE